MKSPHIRTRNLIDPQRFGPGLNAHKLVAETAVRMAQECWEAHMSANNALYRSFRENLTEKQALTAFVARVAPTLLEDARLALTDCLSQPDRVVPPSMKAQIAEALIADSPLRANRVVAADHAVMPSGMVH